MPVSHRFSRRAAAIGAALALAALPISATVTPAFSSPIPTVDASSNPDADAFCGSRSNCRRRFLSSDDADTTADGTDGAEAESSSADNGVTEVDGDEEEGDKACKDQIGPQTNPAIDGELTTDWHKIGNEMSVPENDQDAPDGTLPKSWVGAKAPEQSMKRVPAQSSDDTASDSTADESDTDDSGQSVDEATAESAPRNTTSTTKVRSLPKVRPSR